MCHLCYSMHPFRDLPSLSQNGYSNHLIAAAHSDSPVGSYRGKYGFRGGMAITTDGYAPQNAYHNQSHNHPSLNGHSHPNTHHTLNNDSAMLQTNLNQTPVRMRVRDVWAHDFRKGMEIVRELALKSSYVAVDTEFPGVVAKVAGEYPNSFEQAYHNIKVNIDMLKPIQIGFSFFNERGERIRDSSTIQFNIKWNVDKDTHAVDSIQLLEGCGIDFHKLKSSGIELADFAEAFIASGLALNDKITWIGFHSAYDFAYMMKICTGWSMMPDNFLEFQKYLFIHFPRIVDLKVMMSEHKIPQSGLQDLANLMHVDRVGNKHQAGSDAMLTGETFFRFLEEHGNSKIEQCILNRVYGLNYCPNGVSNKWMQTNTSSPQSDISFANRNVSCSSALYRDAVHSAGQSGRTSPTDSTSGHKSS